MSRRSEWLAVIAVLSALVLLRAWPFVWWPGAQFDADQGTVGLMAKHVSEGRAFPLYFYGQRYMLAVEAWMAAPVMLLLGPTVMALKTPLVAINIGAVLLLLRLAVRDAGLRPALAAVAVLPLALPAAGVAARVVDANGGNVEPLLYILLLWAARARPWVFGIVLGVGGLHREFTFYGAMAIAAMDLARLVAGGARARPDIPRVVRRWSIALAAVLAVRAVAAALEPFASALGPGTTGTDPALLASTVDLLSGRVCLDPSRWPSRAALLFGNHLPRLTGGLAAPLSDYGILARGWSGTAGMFPWAAVLTLTGLAAGVRHAAAGRRAAGPTVPAHDAPRPAAFPAYLVLAGLISTAIYGFAACSDIRVETLRYNLLAVFVVPGALMMALRGWTAPPAVAGVAAAAIVWCALNTADVVAIGREYLVDPPADQRMAIATALERRGVPVAWSAFRVAYHVTFLARERVRVSADDFIRIRAYADEAAAAGAPTISDRPCGDGEVLVPGVHLCP